LPVSALSSVGEVAGITLHRTQQAIEQALALAGLLEQQDEVPKALAVVRRNRVPQLEHFHHYG
jgi:hypothetical protein